MAKQERLPQHASVAIIGAGAAGVTASAALALLRPDVEIDIFESRAHILDIQRGCANRFLRPHIYDWPEAGASEDDAGLPILNWSADTAQNVAKTIESQFKRIVRNSKRVHLYTFSHVKEVKVGKNFFDLIVEDLESNKSRTNIYRWVIVCIGFGLEKRLSSNNPSYWRPSILTQPILQHSEPRVFISGNGDGGLIDFAMAAFDSLDHASLENLVIRCKGIEEAKKTLRLIEKDSKVLHSSGKKPLDIYNEYRKRLFIPNSLIKQIRSKLRKRIRIVFHTREEHLFNLKSAILNRFIVYLIDLARDVDDRIQFISNTEADEASLDSSEIKLADGRSFPIDYKILRFGPDKSEVRKPFEGILVEPPVADIEVPKLSPEVKAVFTERAQAKTGRRASPRKPRRAAHHAKAERQTLQSSGRWWIYGLVGLRKTERLYSAGCFYLSSEEGRTGRIDDGTVYRIDPMSGEVIEHRGNWDSERFELADRKMKLFYRMQRPPSLSKIARNAPSRYESVMELRRRSRRGAIGEESWDGWFEDLGDRRGVWGNIVAERLSEKVESREAAYSLMKSGVRPLMNTLSKLMWPGS